MKIGFYSCMSGMPWGGSEALWWRTARRLQDDGHDVSVNYKWWPEPAQQLVELRDAGGKIWFRNQPKSYLETKTDNLKKFFSKNGVQPTWLETAQPDSLLITLGYHPDRLPIADECIRRKIPYAINVQSASTFYFIHSDNLDKYRRWYRGATKVYFVSPENELKLQNNLAIPFENSEIIANPFNVAYDSDPHWPKDDSKFKLAVVGRFHFQSKGQDLVVDALKQPKWKERPIQITFYGHDQGQLQQLQDLIVMHGLEEKLILGGFVERVEEIWENNHALLLPSRYEGAPLVVIEAMLCGRMVIATNTGRNEELIDEGETGFIAEGPTVRLVDDALERAWTSKTKWQQMGALAGVRIRERYPADPIQEFAQRLLSLQPSTIASVAASDNNH